MGTQGYLPRGGACVSRRRRKMVVNITLCIIWNGSVSARSRTPQRIVSDND